MTAGAISRRRAITITAGAAGALALGFRSVPDQHFVWRGTALGANGRIRISGYDQQASRNIVDRALAEIDRLESIFSLFRPDSELVQLNRTGRLLNPSHDMRILLSRALNVWEMTQGAFNPAIQPLWRFLDEHFSNGRTKSDPDAAILDELLSRCDPTRIRMPSSAITLAPGMALSFNGIAQGYITDAVADLMRSDGLTDILVQLGEIRALPGRSWPIGIPSTSASFRLADGAIATSEPSAFAFTSDGRWNHILDPASGRSADAFSSVSVATRSACLADALSTAAAVSGDLSILEKRFPDVAIWARTSAGETSSFGDFPGETGDL